MTLPSPTPKELARRLIERESARVTGSHPASTAVHAACEHLYRGLSLWLGIEGCRALFQRVLGNMKETEPVLAGIEIRGVENGWGLEGVAKAADAFGDATAAAALEALLTELIDVLGRFIGIDLVVTLAEPSRPPAGPSELGGKEA